MTEVSNHNFGLLIAYLLPGFVAVWGCSFVSPLVWSLVHVPQTGPTVGGFLYLTLACTAVGVTISTVRWAVIDRIHFWCGIRHSEWNFGKLRDNVAAFDMLVEIHYRYYQFHANMFVAVAMLLVLYRSSIGFISGRVGWFDAVAIAVEIVLFAGSRDTLRKYYERTEQLMGGRVAADAK